MRSLLSPIEANLWSEVSAVIFAVMFIVLTVWVFLPTRKSEYARAEKLPLAED